MSDFTLILLVNGRENFTKRWLEYMSLVNFKHKIVIGNGNKKKDYLLKKIINHTRYSKLKIEYHSYNNKNYKDYYFMMYDIVKKQRKSNYIKFCDNDDFILPFQLQKLLEIIKKDKNLISVGDRAMWFSLLNGSIYGDNMYYWPDNFYRETEKFNIKNINDIFINFQESFYNIFRKKFILKALNEVYKIDFSDLEIRDFYLKLRIMSFGKTKFVNQVSYLRQHGTSQTSGNNFSYIENFVKKDISNDLLKLKNNLIKNINNFKLNENSLLKGVEKGYISYLNNVVDHNLRPSRYKKLFLIKEILKNNFPILLNFIKKIQYFKNNFLLKKNYYKNFDLFNKELIIIKNFLNNLN